MEREHILDAFRNPIGWSAAPPAQPSLGMKRTSLLYRMEKLKISRGASVYSMVSDMSDIDCRNI